MAEVYRDNQRLSISRIKYSVKPFFLNINLNLVNSKQRSPSEIVFVRDTAEELLEKYENSLSEEEKKRLGDIMKSMEKLRAVKGK